jgi:hypothetical protein
MESEKKKFEDKTLSLIDKEQLKDTAKTFEFEDILESEHPECFDTSDQIYSEPEENEHDERFSKEHPIDEERLRQNKKMDYHAETDKPSDED